MLLLCTLVRANGPGGAPVPHPSRTRACERQASRQVACAPRNTRNSHSALTLSTFYPQVLHLLRNLNDYRLFSLPLFPSLLFSSPLRPLSSTLSRQRFLLFFSLPFSCPSSLIYFRTTASLLFSSTFKGQLAFSFNLLSMNS